MTKHYVHYLEIKVKQNKEEVKEELFDYLEQAKDLIDKINMSIKCNKMDSGEALYKMLSVVYNNIEEVWKRINIL